MQGFCANNGENQLSYNEKFSGVSRQGIFMQSSRAVKGFLSMFRKIVSVFLLWVIVQGVAVAQEGFPLDGTWRGFWGLPGGEETLAVIVMNWDGEAISGRINPGRNMIFFEEASLEAESWTLSFTSTSKAGEAIAFEGVLENIGSYKRTITGTWSIAGVDNVLVLTRE